MLDGLNREVDTTQYWLAFDLCGWLHQTDRVEQIIGNSIQSALILMEYESLTTGFREQRSKNSMLKRD
jgi:hypothetical protein